jgi:hypothetical protein
MPARSRDRDTLARGRLARAVHGETPSGAMLGCVRAGKMPALNGMPLCD